MSPEVSAIQSTSLPSLSAIQSTSHPDLSAIQSDPHPGLSASQSNLNPDLSAFQSTSYPDLSQFTTEDVDKKNLQTSEANLESRLSLKDLQRLQRSFLIDTDGFNSRLSLTKDQFCEALPQLLKKGSPEEYADLFDKIDIMKVGSVDWDTLTSHLLLEYYEQDDRMKSLKVPQWKDIRLLPSSHKEVIQRVAFIKNVSRYIAISKEGCATWWSLDLRPQGTVRAGTEACRVKDLWVTHFVPLQNLNKIAVAFTSKEIGIYDLSNKLELSCQYRIQGLKSTPLCLDYWSSPSQVSEALLVWGDVGGNIHVLFFHSANIALFERPPAPANDKQEPCLNVQLKDVISNRYKYVSYVMYEAHTDDNKGEWVKKVLYSQSLECFMSCATTSSTSLVIAWMEKKTKVSQRSIFAVQQGINDFDFSEKLNLIATACANSYVYLWNPYVTSKPNGILRGHMASVVQIQFVTVRNQLISLSKDKVMRIWDVQLQVCIQRLAGMFPKGPEVFSFLLFENSIDRDGHERNRMFITFGHQITVMDMKTEVKGRTFSHDRPVVSALYNSQHGQVISICQAGTIVMWLIDTGQKLKQLNKTHGNSEVTCLAQDQSGTRLYTGSTDGTVKVWDWNGHCYHSLECAGGHPCDVAQILVLKRDVVVVGWSKSVTVFRNNTFKEFLVKPTIWKTGQEDSDDIVSCSFLAPHTLVTGSYNGQIIIWNTNSENASRCLTQRSHHSIKSRGNTLTDFKSKNNSELHKMEETLGTEGVRKSAFKRGTLDNQDELSCAVTRLIFLESRRTDQVNLVSCGGSGWVRFWSPSQSNLAAEFVAHETTGTIIMATDAKNHYLVTGDTDGSIRVWEIQNYALQHLDQPISHTPEMKSHFEAHQDQINSLELCERNDKLLIISASSDCTAALWDISGVIIGIFGQQEHWKIQSVLPPVDVSNYKILQGTVKNSSSTKEENGDLPVKTDLAVEAEANSCRINAWEKTILGKKYQHLRVQKRERKQPGKIDNLPQIKGERTNSLLAGPFSLLETKELSPVLTITKPDTDKHFSHRPVSSKFVDIKLPALLDTLMTAFDEKSVFPSYILEYEKKMKNYHTVLLQSEVQDSGVNREQSHKPTNHQKGILTKGSKTTSIRGARKFSTSTVNTLTD